MPSTALLTIPSRARSGAVRIGTYTPHGTRRLREIVALRRNGGWTVVIDRLASTREDPRVVAELSPEEPAENAGVVTRLYLADPTRGRCQRLEDCQQLGREATARGTVLSDRHAGAVAEIGEILDKQHVYVLRPIDCEHGTQLLWTSTAPASCSGSESITLRSLVGRMEAYEPARSITLDAVERQGERLGVRTDKLRRQLEKLDRSPLVLNRRLREVVQARIAAGTSMSEIAMRCGMVKTDRRGHLSGETSWLLRRIGVLPEAAASGPGPWVHTEVFAKIAREVEL